MARVAVSASLKGSKELTRRLKGYRKRAKNPLGGSARRPAAQVLRGSVLEEFRRGGRIGSSGSFTPWQKAQDFGDCEPSARTLGGTSGSMGQAWANAREIPSANGVAIIAEHPGMRLHKEGGVVKAKKRTASGDLAMRVFLGMKCAVWVSEAKALAGFVFPARPFGGKTPFMLRGLERVVVEAILAR